MFGREREFESFGATSPPLCGGPASWVAETLAIEARDGRGLEPLHDVAGRTARACLCQLGLPAPGPEGLRRHVDRIAATIALHRKRIDGRRPAFEEVVEALQAGKVGGRRLGVNILAEVVLAEAVAQGVPEAMARLAEGFGPMIARALRTAGGARAESEFEDLLAVIIERPERYLAGYRGESSLSGWLARVAETSWVSHARACQREDRRLAGLASALLDDTAHADASPADPIEEYEGCGDLLARIAREALAVLDDREAAMFRMVVLEGLSQAEYARRIDRDKATVTRWMARARAKLSGRVAQLFEASGRRDALNEAFDVLMSRHAADRPALGAPAARLLRLLPSLDRRAVPPLSA